MAHGKRFIYSWWNNSIMESVFLVGLYFSLLLSALYRETSCYFNIFRRIFMKMTMKSRIIMMTRMMINSLQIRKMNPAAYIAKYVIGTFILKKCWTDTSRSIRLVTSTVANSLHIQRLSKSTSLCNIARACTKGWKVSWMTKTLISGKQRERGNRLLVFLILIYRSKELLFALNWVKVFLRGLQNIFFLLKTISYSSQYETSRSRAAWKAKTRRSYRKAKSKSSRLIQKRACAEKSQKETQ